MAIIQLKCGCQVPSPEWFVSRKPDWPRVKKEIEDKHECTAPAAPEGKEN